MNNRGKKRPLQSNAAGLMDKFVIKSANVQSLMQSEDDHCIDSSPKRSKIRESGFDPNWTESFPWVLEKDNGN